MVEGSPLPPQPTVTTSTVYGTKGPKHFKNEKYIVTVCMFMPIIMQDNFVLNFVYN